MAQQLDSWIAVAEAIGPFLNSPDPFAALSKAGYTFAGDVAERLRTALPRASVRPTTTREWRAW